MVHQSISRGLSDCSDDIRPDKRWLGTLLCCLSALVTTVFIALVTTSLMATADRDIARGDNQIIDRLTPAEGASAD